MMKAITFLGVRPQPTCYVSVDGRMIEAQHFGIALTRLYPDLDLCLLVTRKARDEQLPYFTEQIAAHAASLDVIDIPNGDNSDELWTIFEKVVAAVEEGDVVIFDITHGFRSLPFISFLVAAYLRVVKRITIEAVLYGNYEASDRNFTPPRAPIVDLTQFVSLLDWTVAADRFVRFGDAHDLAERLRAAKPSWDAERQDAELREQGSRLGKTAKSLDDVSRALRLIRPQEAMVASHRVQALFTDATLAALANARPFLPISRHVADAFAPIALNAQEQSTDPVFALAQERRMVHWYLERKQYVPALAVAREWLISWAMLQLGMSDVLNRKLREEVETAIGQALSERRRQHGAFSEYAFSTGRRLHHMPQVTQALDLYQTLGDSRNDLLHAGKRPGAKTAADMEKEIISLCRRLDQFALPIESDAIRAT